MPHAAKTSKAKHDEVKSAGKLGNISAAAKVEKTIAEAEVTKPWWLDEAICQHANRSCPAGHGLKEFLTPMDGYTRSKCCAEVPKGTK